MEDIRSLKDLPNVHGYEFTGIMKDGTPIDCQIYKDVCGAYQVLSAYSKNRAFSELKGWQVK